MTSNSSSELCWSYSNKFDWGVKKAGDSDEQAVSVGDVVSCLELMPVNQQETAVNENGIFFLF